MAVAIGGGALTRDAFLSGALRAGASEALWIDPSLGWAERYREPVRVGGVSSGAPADEFRFAQRELVWAGETLHWTA